MATYSLRIALELFIEALDAADRHDRDDAIKRIVELYEREVKEAQK